MKRIDPTLFYLEALEELLFEKDLDKLKFESN